MPRYGQRTQQTDRREQTVCVWAVATARGLLPVAAGLTFLVSLDRVTKAAIFLEFVLCLLVGGVLLLLGCAKTALDAHWAVSNLLLRFGAGCVVIVLGMLWVFALLS